MGTTTEPKRAGLSTDTKWVIGTIVSAILVVSGLLSAQIAGGNAGLNTRIGDLNRSLNTRIDDLRDDLREMRDRMDTFDRRLDAVEIALGKVEQRLETVERAVLSGSGGSPAGSNGSAGGGALLAAPRVSGAEARPEPRISVAFSFLPRGTTLPRMYQTANVTFFSIADDSSPIVHGTPAEQGYRFPDAGVTVALPVEVETVDLRLCLNGAVTIETLNSAGESMSQGTVESGNQCLDLPPLQGERISSLRLTGGNGEASIVRLEASSE